MKAVTLPLPLLGITLGTRAMLGAGVALILSNHLDARQRQTVGWTLAGVGVFTTIPLLREVFFSGRLSTARPPTLGAQAPGPQLPTL